MTFERRKCVRFRLDVPGLLYLYQFDVKHPGRIFDLSMGGCFFPVAGDAPVGEKCQITLTSGEGLTAENTRFTGVIVRKTADGVGIQFHDMSPEQKTSLNHILSEGSAVDKDV